MVAATVLPQASVRFCYYVRIRNSNLQLYRVAGYNSFSLQAQSAVPDVANGWYEFFATVSPTTIEVGLGDTVYHTITDNTYRGGVFGVYGRNIVSSPSGIIYRKVQVLDFS